MSMRIETLMVGIVFAQVPDPVGMGLVESVSRPGGNITGCIDVTGFSETLRDTKHIFKVGLNYKFDVGKAPGIARY
jgi:ABC-type uncharacterized transport system substrate-binding protein